MQQFVMPEQISKQLLAYEETELGASKIFVYRQQTKNQPVA